MYQIPRTNMKSTMTRLLRVATLALGVGLAATWVADVQAQSGNWDPYVHSVIISPAPLLPLEFNGTGVCSLKPGNNGGTPLPLGSPGNPTDLMTVQISLANGVPNVANPLDPIDALNALGGPGKDYWTWTYTVATRTFYGIQRLVIPAYTAEEVTVQYKVTENTFLAANPLVFNGLNVNISPPGYTNPQTTDNDKASSYTYVAAKDYGDDPISYGEALHNVDVTRDGNNYTTKFFWLGPFTAGPPATPTGHLDAEPANQASADAMGDDNNTAGGLYGLAQDDEDGVVFPVMIPGTTVSITVSWNFPATANPTVTARPYANLTAWIDWNGDGVFDDGANPANNEVITHTAVWDDDLGDYTWVQNTSSGLIVPQRRSTGSKVLNVTVPVGAVTDRPIFARFRVATDVKLPPTGMAGNGEVEDYQIGLGLPPVAVNDEKLNNPTGTPVTVTALGNDSATSPKTLNPASVQIVGTPNPGAPLVVPGEGTWTVNTTTGEITFTPETGFTGDPTPIHYTVKDTAGLTSNTATVTITYGSPTAARLAYFKAVSIDGGPVQLAWGTLVETGALGFHVDRSTPGGDWERITSKLVAASGGFQQPQTYFWVDDRASLSPDLTYRLSEIDLRGTEVVLAEATVQAGMTAGIAVRSEGLSLNLRGSPNDTVTVESAPAVHGPWTPMHTVTLDGLGSGKLNLEIDTTLPLQFYRILSE